MQLKLCWPSLDRRANVSVEFALIATFFLLPLIAGTLDFVSIITAQARLNTALQTMLYYAWTNDSTLTSSTVLASNTNNATAQLTMISALNHDSVFNISLGAGTQSGSYSNVEYACVSGSNGNYAVSALQAFTAGTTCPNSEKMQLYIQYTLSTSFALPFPVPLSLPNPYSLSVTGVAEI